MLSSGYVLWANPVVGSTVSLLKSSRLMGRVQLEELSDLREVGVVRGVNLAQHLDRLLRLADSLGERPVHCVIFSVGRAGETRAVDELTSQDRRVGSRMVGLALRARTPAEAQRHRRAI